MENDLRRWMRLFETLTPVVYHGGAEGIETFHSSVKNRAFPAWFTDDKAYAEHYARGVRGGAVYAARLDLKHPLNLSGKYDLTHGDLLRGDAFCKMAGLDPAMFSQDFLKNGIDFEEVNSPAFVQGLIKSGYDGLIVDEQGARTFAVISSSQVIDAQRIDVQSAA